MARAALRELVYRLRAKPGATPTHLPLLLAAAGATVETTVAHLDDQGHVWRILHVRGNAEAIARARGEFDRYEPGFLLEKNVLGEGPGRLILWYKYRSGPVFSNTAAAFRLLGRDTVVTDRAQGGVLTIRVLGRAGAGMQEFLRAARRAAAKEFEFQLLYLGPPREETQARLTDAESATLAAAKKLGYYDVPRRAGVREVARVVGISASAAGYRLRRAEGKLVGAVGEG